MRKFYYFWLVVFLFCSLVKAQNNTFFEKGKIALQNSEIEKAIAQFKYGLQANKNAADTIKARYSLYLGIAQKTKLDYKNAIENYYKALTVYEKSTESNGLLETYLAFAEYYRAARDESNAKLFLSKAEKIISKTGIIKRLIAKYYNRKAAIFNQFNYDYPVAIAASNQAIAVAKTINDFDIIASSYNEIGYIYVKNNWNGAEAIYLKALKLFESQGNQIYYCNVLNNIVNLNIKNKNYAKALELAQKGLKISNENKSLFNELSFLECIHKIYYLQGKTDLAYQSLLNYLKLREKYREIVHDQKVAEIASKYDFEKKEKQLQISDLTIYNQNLKIESSNNKSKTYSIVLVVLFLSIIPIILLLFKSKKDNKKLQKLHSQNEILVSESNHRINNNLQLLSVFINQELTNAGDETTESINKILAKVNSIALLHKHLYKSKDADKVNLSDYLNAISEQFKMEFETQNIQTDFTIESIEFASNKAIYLGLLYTELLLNSMKHAFFNQTNCKISCKVLYENEQLSFEYKDNGSGIDSKIKPKLVDLLCKQLKVNYEISYNEGFRFYFKQ